MYEHKTLKLFDVLLGGLSNPPGLLYVIFNAYLTHTVCDAFVVSQQHISFWLYLKMFLYQRWVSKLSVLIFQLLRSVQFSLSNWETPEVLD